MEKTIAPQVVGGGFVSLYDTPHYAVVKMALPKKRADSPPGLLVFCVVDKEFGVVYGARSSFGQAIVTAGIAEMERAEGIRVANEQKARGFTLPTGDDEPTPKSGNGFGLNG